jgi:acyl phosphate:glycerol-3-phosphate acyltransferase
VRVVAAAKVGYLFGTFPTADFAARAATRGEVDLHEAGTGNPGAANAMAVLGKKWGAVVFAGDAAKGALAALAGRAIAGDAGASVAGTMAVAGHIWPVWNGFRGGKGVATATGATAVTCPPAFPIVGTALGVGAISEGGAERAVQLAAPVWIALTFALARRGRGNGWGPRPDGALVAGAVATSAMVLAKFATSSSRSPRRPG